MQTAAAYIRVSTEEQIEFSPDSQRKKIKEYADSHNINLPDQYIYVDEGISGRHAQTRPSFMKMISEAKLKPPPFQIILVWKFSRFARNRQDSILYKSMLRKECGIDVISITEQLSNDPTAILIEAMLEAMDEYYSINLAEEVRRGMNEKFVRGGVVSQPPFGYRMGDESFVPELEKASLVQMIFDSFNKGVPCRQIAEQLNAAGVRTNRGNHFDVRAIQYILKNPVYVGKQRRTLNSQKTNVVNGKHTAIIPEDLFWSVQKQICILENASRTYTRDKMPNDYMLRGLVRCSSCGSTLTLSSKGNSLQCHKYAKGQCSQSHSISLNKLNKAVLEQLHFDLGSMKLYIAPSVDHSQNGTNDKQRIQKIIKAEHKRLIRAKEAYEAGVDSLEEYSQSKAEIFEHIQRYERILTETEFHKNEFVSFEVTGDQLIRALNSSVVSESVKNKLLRSFIYKIEFSRPVNTIQIIYYNPFITQE